MLKIAIFVIAVVALFGLAHAGGTTSICDRYSAALGLNNTALMTTFVTTAFGRLLGQDITAPYFTGQIGRDQFNNSIDYTKNTSAFNLLAFELVAFFGSALTCTDKDFPAYNGTVDMKVVHKNNMIDKDAFEVFNQQLVNIGQVLGFNHTDYDTLATVLESFRSDICTAANCNTSPHTVFVGSGGNFFTPSNGYSFPTGTTVTFVWSSNATSHSVTQGSTFGGCSPLSGGFDSTTQSGPANFSHTFNTSGSYYFFCKVGSHCAGGMYGVINITGNPVSTTASSATTGSSSTAAAATTASSTTGAAATTTTRPPTTASTTAATTSGSGNSNGSGASTVSVLIALVLLVAALLF